MTGPSVTGPTDAARPKPRRRRRRGARTARLLVAGLAATSTVGIATAIALTNPPDEPEATPVTTIPSDGARPTVASTPGDDSTPSPAVPGPTPDTDTSAS